MSFSMMMPFNRMWDKFSKSKTLRHEFVSGYVKRSIPAQIRHLMKQRGLTQSKLAQQAGLTQGVISRAADVNYGDLTLNTIVRIAAGFDCAFVGKYVPFSEFLKGIDQKIDVDVPSFEQQNEDFEKAAKQEMEPAKTESKDEFVRAMSELFNREEVKGLDPAEQKKYKTETKQREAEKEIKAKKKPSQAENILSFDKQKERVA